MIDTKHLLTKMQILIDHSEASKTNLDRVLLQKSEHDKMLAINSDMKHAKNDQEKYVVITSSMSYHSRVFNILSRVENYHQNSIRKYSSVITKHHNNVRWGRVIQDEFHKVKNSDVLNINIFNNLLSRPYF